VLSLSFVVVVVVAIAVAVVVAVVVLDVWMLGTHLCHCFGGSFVGSLARSLSVWQWGTGSEMSGLNAAMFSSATPAANVAVSPLGSSGRATLKFYFTRAFEVAAAET